MSPGKHEIPNIQFELLFEESPDLYLILSPDLVIITASDNYLKTTLTSKEAIVGKYVFDVFPDNPDAATTGSFNLKQSFDYVTHNRQAHAMPTQQYDIQHADGRFETKFWDILNKPVLNKQNELLYIINSVKDVTEYTRLQMQEKKQSIALEESNSKLLAEVEERKRLQQELEELNAVLSKQVDKKTTELNSIFERIADGFISLDKDFRYTHVNKKAGELTHRNPESLIGKYIWDEFPDAVGTDTYHAFNKAMQSQQYMVNTDYFEPLDLWQENHIYPSENGLTIFIRDITQKKKAEQQLSEVYNDMHTALNSITDGVISVDNNFRYTFINDAALTNIARTREEMLGKTLLEIRPELAHTPFWKKYQEVMQTKVVGEIEGFFAPLNIWALVKIYPSKDGLTFFYKDVTAAKKIQNALVASEKKYRLLFDNNPLPMWMIDVNTLNIVDVNEAAIEHYGYTRAEFLGMNIRDIRPTEDIAKMEAASNQKNSSIRKAGIWTHLKKDGTQIKVEITSHDINYLEQKTRLILSNDVTDKVMAEDALLKLNGELRQLYTHQQNIREEERKYIAREIHDELGQLITGLKMDISWLKQRIIQKQPELTEKLNESIGLLDESVKTIRKISSELRPGILDDLGIIDALAWLAKDFEKRTQIQCKINNLAGDSIDCSDEVKVVLFRVFQEALTNIMRHAEATAITTEISKEKNLLTMQIADNGKGYDVTKQTKTLGILGMKERIANVNGALYISSAPGRGTSITIIISI